MLRLTLLPLLVAGVSSLSDDLYKTCTREGEGSLYDFSMNKLDGGETVSFSDYMGKVGL